MQLLIFFETLKETFNSENHVFSIGGMQVDLEDEDEKLLISKLKKSKIYSIQSATCKISNQFIRYFRGKTRISPQNGWENSSYFDTLEIFDQAIEDFDIISFHELIEKQFKLSSASDIQELNADKSLLISHQEIIGRLEQTLAEVGEDFTKARLKLESDFSIRKAELEEETLYIRKTLEENNSVERKALEKRIKELDDRDNTHVRREIRNQFKEHLSEYKEKFELTKATQELRKPIQKTVFWSMILLISVFLLFTILPLQNTKSDFTIFWHLKTLAITITGIGLITWYLRWNSKWSEQHANAEFELKQLELDMDRASWVVESALEWENEKNRNMPDALLEAISRNLFTDKSNFQEKELNAADHLASALLGEASKATVRVGDNELVYDRKALKKATT